MTGPWQRGTLPDHLDPARISPKVLKSLKGTNGTNGSNGTAEYTGPAGPQGAAGGKGETGPQGVKGETGPAGPQGPKGATGATGPSGTTGFTKTLPKGETETGTWATSGGAATQCFERELTVEECEAYDLIYSRAFSAHPVILALSFSIPLAEAPEESSITVIGVGEGSGEPQAKSYAGCKGNYKEPGAEEGHLCIFEARTSNIAAVFIQESEITTSGVVMLVKRENRELAYEVWGTWAVTGA